MASLKVSYVPKSITNLLNDLQKVQDVSQRWSVLNDYMREHEEELARVMVFKRELPQCMLLLMDAIEVLKVEIRKAEKEKEHAEEQKRISELLARNKRSYENYNQNEQMNNTNVEQGHGQYLVNPLSAANSWDSYRPDLNRTDQPYNYGENGKGKEVEREVAVVTKTKYPRIGSSDNHEGISLVGNESAEEPHYQQEPRQQAEPMLPEPTDLWRNITRRYWTPDLHARFLDALNILGGPEVATPKQIKETMQIEGLTTDQVKSHLQKYRNHNRECLRNGTDEENQPVGHQNWPGIWMTDG
ncbi:transcription factor HHO5-like [Ziziphus jujuba]|uniref:Transcription factor HHO5-like n=1 Tax=Ziziphus jujuba TaxID=326968 RepID=A0ABM3IHP0_ZIZJJ|nr:transcription factor HHO5-like [Ziziphus jujuba]